MKCREMVQHSQYWATSIQSGKYRTADMYKDIRGDRGDVCWKKLVHNNHARPRACFTLWLVMLGRLPTKDRLAKIGIITDGICVFCQENETLPHLFFHCEYTQRIWVHILEWNGYSRSVLDWEREKLWLIGETKKKGWRRDILKISLTETIYYIWITRNAAIFQNQVPINVIQNIKQAVVTRCSGRKALRTHVNKELMRIG
ncbi:uncharacterized protein LOC131650566 [Vicia villosa]|uniref:uncharacterized protein LOC131650566 n=1 Tax=Vicia villosa TaxID=3911 RepID=UPI00273C13B6|nr:uncharacterized protein LOC131650566 [Vicia villosa]